MGRKLWKCRKCETVLDRLTPSCIACGAPNALSPAPKGSRMRKRVEMAPMQRSRSSLRDLDLSDLGKGKKDDDLDLDLDVGSNGPSFDDASDYKEPQEAIPLGEIEVEFPDRVSFGMRGLNRVLGCNRGTKGPYGAARGASIMLKAMPGVGKSTLAMQIAKKLAKKGHKVVIATGEQSESDVRIYAEAFGGLSKREKKNILVLKTQDTDDVIAAVAEHEPILLVLDSVQMFRSRNAKGNAASEPQCSYIHKELVVGTCKEIGTITLLISQVTKDGEFRGPNTLAHLADADLLMKREGVDEEDETNQKRTLCAETKNRFGMAGVTARFLMTDKGLVGLKDKKKPKDKAKKSKGFKRRK